MASRQNQHARMEAELQSLLIYGWGMLLEKFQRSAHTE